MRNPILISQATGSTHTTKIQAPMTIDMIPTASMGFFKRKIGEPQRNMEQLPGLGSTDELLQLAEQGFVIEEVKEIQEIPGMEGELRTVHCACTEIQDVKTETALRSHEQTMVIGKILCGNGKLVCGNQILDVKKDHEFAVNMKFEYGFVNSDPKQPFRIFLFYLPALAAASEPLLRDEKLAMGIRPSARILFLQKSASAAAQNVLAQLTSKPQT
jgi:hypothetical protein